MASVDAGDWMCDVISILTSSQNSVNKSHIPQIVKSILYSKEKLLNHEEETENFYAPYAALCAHYISVNAAEIKRSQVPVTGQACKVLLQYLLQKLQTFTEQSCLLQKQIMNLIRCFCKNDSALQRADIMTLTTMLKSAKIPSDFLLQKAPGHEFYKEDVRETKPHRLDQNTSILEQLMTPLLEIPGERKTRGTGILEQDSDSTVIQLPDQGEETKALLFSKNTISLQQLNGGDILLEMCLALPSVHHYVSQLNDTLAGKGLGVPSCVAGALLVSSSYRTVMNDISIVGRALNLQVLEPLTEERLQKLTTIALGCLYTSIAVATASSILMISGNPPTKGIGAHKDDENDNCVVSIVKISLETYNTVSTVIHSSARAGGHNLQNLHLGGSWLLLTGLQNMLNLYPLNPTDKGREGSSKSKGTSDPSSGSKPKEPPLPKQNMMKIQQGFGVLFVALASQAVSLMTNLLVDLQVETGITEEQPTSFLSQPTQPLVAEDMTKHLTAWQRVHKLTSNLNLINLLFSIASVNYRKACMLKRIQKQPVDGDGFSTSDSNTYYEDDFSSSDDSSDDEDDDSEPILGQWFEETLAPEDCGVTVTPGPPATTPSDSDVRNGKPAQGQASESASLIPEKGEPHGYIRLACRIFNFLNNYFVSSENLYIRDYLRSKLGESQMVVLAGIIKDLDRETSRSETGTISIYFGAELSQLYDDFSRSLARFLHNLMATKTLSDGLQNVLLAQMGVNPWNQEDWPLQVYSRTLSILAQVLLLRQQREKDELRSESEAACSLILQRFLNTLKKVILTPGSVSIIEEGEDVNVEHAQLLLFLFHNLQLMQKKKILLLTGQTILDVAPIVESPKKDFQIIYLSRLLLIFEYMMKNLYDAPSSLIDQVTVNLFSSLTGPTISEKDNTRGHSRMFFACQELEENYSKNLPSDDVPVCVMKPRFYNLTNVDINTQDVPKLDGFACSFTLGTPDVLKYSALYSALSSLLTVTRQCDISEKLSFLGVCAVQYTFSCVWRLLLCLPPSVSSLESLATSSQSLAPSQLLMSAVWSPRCNQQVFFYGWIKDALVKQGLTTQKAEALLRSVTKNTGNVRYDIKIVKEFINKQLTEGPVSLNGPIFKDDLPELLDMITLEAIVAKLQMGLDACFAKPKSDSLGSEAKEFSQELLPVVLQLVEMYSTCIRWSLLHQMSQNSSNDTSPSTRTLQAYDLVLRMSSSQCAKISSFALAIAGYLPASLRGILDKWNSCSVALCNWRNDFTKDVIPSEGYVCTVTNSHISTLSEYAAFTTNPNTKRLLRQLVRFAGDLMIWCPDNFRTQQIIRSMLPLLLDSTTESVSEPATLALDRFIGSADSEECLPYIYQEVLARSYDLLIDYSSGVSEVDEKIFHECLKFMEGLLDKQMGKKALEKFFTENPEKDMINILLSASNENLSPTYGTRVLKFFSKLFQQVEKNPSDKTLEKLCSTLSKMSKLSKLDTSALHHWLEKIISGAPSQLEGDEGSMQENRLLLQSLTSYIVKENSAVGEEVANAILSALIPMGSKILSPASEGIGFSELMVVMATLAGAGSGSGHLQLFKAATGWLELCKKYLVQKDVLEKLEDNVPGGKHQIMMESTCYLLSYLADVVGALKMQNERGSVSSRSGATSPPCDGEFHHPEIDSDWAEEIGPDEDESAGEDSDEDSICNKLCTFTMTQKEFMNQHWYHCHTCKMIDGVGVCTVCAKVCHKDHDVTYAKFGSFFCDCGAKEDGTCQALVKRSALPGPESGTSASVTSAFPFSSETILPSSLRRRQSSPTPGSSNLDRGGSSLNGGDGKKSFDEALKHKQALAKLLESFRDALISHMGSTGLPGIILSLLQYLLPAVVKSCQRNSPIGSSTRAMRALHELHTQDKALEHTDQLMVQTLGSQEGAFENVRMNYSGDQGQTIRQLINGHMIHRVAMCCLASPLGKRQHLAVSLEKGKITILQLSALLKQADSSKRKLTLTRLASAPVPFTVLSIAGNLCNEDFLAVCGLKDCHVLSFNSTGSVSDHIVLHPQLEGNNYIIKALWLPGCQTKLAVVSADFIKIYDLSQDALSPQFYFLLPSGKIRDSCFVFTEDGQQHLLIMSSAGHIYYQPLLEESSAQHGPFYVTNIMEIKHTDTKDTNGTVAGGGVSIYYSHTMQLLFFSYSNSKSFIAPLPKMTPEISLLFQIHFASSNGNDSKSNPQPLCQWSEIPQHPGLVLALMQSSNNPVTLMVKPDSIQVQEIKYMTAKSKITDLVALRHLTYNGETRTTLILLCEDGSLRIYMANQESTGFWLMPAFQPTPLPSSKPSKKKKTAKSGRPPGAVNFPVDFFEQCTSLSDVEFGGNDVLQIYNTQQLKHRLNTTAMYIASTKPTGFSVEVTNTDNSMVMVGARVLLGSQDSQRVPSYIEVFGRCVQVSLTRNRWFDLPFTHEESLTADKKLTITFGPSSDPSGITMVDSIKIYGKSKENFGWPEDSEDFPSATGTSLPVTGPVIGMDSDGIPAAPLPLTPTDRLVSSILEVFDGCFSVRCNTEGEKELRDNALDLATNLLTLPTPPIVHQHVKALLATLHYTQAAYSSHKDQALLNYVIQCLNTNQDIQSHEDLDGEAFYRLVAIARGVAVSRPSNLVQFAENHERTLTADSSDTVEVSDLEAADHLTPLPTSPKPQNNNPDHGESPGRRSPRQSSAVDPNHFLIQLTDSFWRLHAQRPKNHAIAPVSRHGLVHIDATVQALVEVIHAFTSCDLENVPLAAKLYVRLLLSDDTAISFAAKDALVRLLRPRLRRRKVFIPSPPHCSTPGETQDTETTDSRTLSQAQATVQAAPQVQRAVQTQSQNQVSQEEQQDFEMVEGLEPVVLLPGENESVGANLEALIAGQASFPPLLDIPPDADDETMVELAIALSLQDQPGHSESLGLQSLSLRSQGPQRASSLEGGHYSDTTASAGASDDEGSTAATDGSTLRTSPAEQGGSAGSESGGSGVDSITGEHNVSGRSSAYGDNVHESTTTGARSETSSVGVPSTSMPHEAEGLELETDVDTSYRLHSLRLILLEKLLQYLPELRDVAGVRAIPYSQVLLMLSCDLQGKDEKDKATLDSLLSAVIAELEMGNHDVNRLTKRTSHREVQLIIMRLLSIMMSRVRTSLKPLLGEASAFCSTNAAIALLNNNTIDFCLQVLKVMLDYWKATHGEKSTGSISLLKPHPDSPPPDMSPFFLRPYVKGHANDVFEAYQQLLTEMVIRLPYQIKKLTSSLPSSPPLVFNQAWYSYLCEYMMMPQAPFVKRQVRKLLLFICGSKEKYRQLRDFHALESHVKNVKVICHQGGYDGGARNNAVISLPYDSLITLIEHLKACTEIATTRTINWQKFCLKDESVLSFLIHVSFLLEEGVSPVLLQLLQSALCGSAGIQPSSSPVKQKKDREKSEEGEEAPRYDEAQCIALAQQVNKFLDKALLSQFIRYFLLESNATSVRWQAHSLIFHLYKNSSSLQQEQLLDLMWKLWPLLPVYGRKAIQFVDLLGFFTLKTSASQKKDKDYMEKALGVIRQQNQQLMTHPNSTIYSALQGYVEFDGYYLESEPCLVCNNPEVPWSNIKLSAIKVDSRFTTSTQMVKLIGSHTISKISLRIAELKRSKMVRTLNIYYNNRTVQSVVELKNRPSIWHKAKKCVLTAGQTELKIEFPLSIVACNLMIEYADFYENFQASSETLQCPRCSASVPANPGVCANCGENVFQCHKCRAINYDEKDPFLCNSCGFCKYAKFEYTLTAKPCCAVDPIENEEDRKKATTTINNLLEKADRVYKQLMANIPALEHLLLRIHEHGMVERIPEDSAAAGNPASNVNRGIQQLAQKYGTDCKASFDELSKIVQKVLASRKELVEYERRQRESRAKNASSTTSLSTEGMVRIMTSSSTEKLGTATSQGRCYGCSSAAVEHCITLLRALATSQRYRQDLCSQGLIKELVECNLRNGTVQVRCEVRKLLCLLTQDNPKATNDLNSLLMEKIATALKGHKINPDLAGAVRHEVALLASSLQKEDSCWEQSLRCVMQLFLVGVNSRAPVVMESITLPCLKTLQMLIRSEAPSNKKLKDKTVEALASVRTSGTTAGVNLHKWLAGDPRHSYRAWKQSMPKRQSESSVVKPQKLRTEELRAQVLMRKYASRWLEKTRRHAVKLKLLHSNWLRQVLFSQSSRAARAVACSVMDSLCQVPTRKREILDMLTAYLDDLGAAGESATEYLTLYQCLIHSGHWKHYLALQGLLPHLGNLITQEIERLTHLEETTLTSDLSQGYALKMQTELLASFIEVDSIRQHYKSRLVGCVLNGYLSLRKLIVQRTKLIDETQEKLLELLEEMTTGTESETKAFMSVCVETVKKYELEDLRTPVFIFERLCSIIYPEENDTGEFFITLEKDPQQEDFLQGRMLGNPYSSTEPGMGPLMRDVKNKICQDCELVALLEDDSGMELLVNNKIISLDLPVKDVYKKVWCSENNETEAMRIIYRMRGLLGDATEEFIENLDNKDTEEVDTEEVYKMANVMSECGGLEVMLERLAAIDDLTRGRPLLMVLLKLFGYCIKVKSNRQKLIDPNMGTIRVMLGTLCLALSAESSELVQGSPGGPTITEQIIQIMEPILVEAADQSLETYKTFCAASGDKKDITFLLSTVTTSMVRNNSSLLQLLMRVVPFLTLGNQEKMETLINHFRPYLNFNKFDFDHTTEDDLQLECFCMLTSGIDRSIQGQQLKDLMLGRGIVQDALEYLTVHAPPVKTALLVASDDWKEFTSKPALKYVLRLLTGLSAGHVNTQLWVSADCIPIIHRLEQVSSDQRVGSLAENLMETLKENPNVAAKIEEVRKQTRDEKKRLAMAMREKQLGALGMKTNERGQVKAKSTYVRQLEELGEESGLVCIICREGYMFQPTKVLGIYTFTKRCNVDDFDNRNRKPPSYTTVPGYTTVTHFNVVHVDCHMDAVRHARGRDEWESAALQNANTKCNGLLPVWGPKVPESAFASCLARHNTYLQESTGHRDISYSSTVHDLKLLLLRFAKEKSFSEESGGGGPQSNIYLIPYLAHMALYVINTTRCTAREDKNITNFLEAPPDKWVENCFEAEGPYYWLTMSVLVHSNTKWHENRVAFLRRLIILAQARHCSPQGTASLSDLQPKDYNVYKPALLFFGLINAFYSILWKRVSVSVGEEWAPAVAEYIRHNDQTLLEAGDKLLRTYEDELLLCQSFMEFCDVVGLLSSIPDPDSFLQETLQMVSRTQDA
ncbi:E3 ubiquitin-protein ligase UBR4-like isoform X2 [Limulus polyphemus]|uniref:E3 ubiquitin-protein ligase UBR4-like isoform X2 n=1 Tax=Limulus polyphemus TaxID=6850 RepID=A0ABM1B9A2_LIMPO|nr:E3 ubiquitin-protein ligase UBR4-like isoform X2 [Limulus polyphemus]